jgi:hypothetical protein
VLLLLPFLLLLPRVGATQNAVPDTIPQGWILKSNAGISLSQSNFNDAWRGDEVGTVSWIATFGFSAERWLSQKINWQNGLLMQFGQTHQQDAGREKWLAPQKSTDKITYRGMVLFHYWGFFEPFVAFDADTQFYTKIESTTRYLTPALLSESAGIARYLANGPRAVVLTRLGFGFRQKINRFGGTAPDYETKTINEGGFEWLTRTKLASAEEKTLFISELRLFKAVETSTTDPVEREYWSSVDVDWQNTLTNKVAKWFAFDLFWQIYYDKQADKRGQFKQTLGFGLTWQLI